MTDITPSPEFLATAYSTVDGGWKRSLPWAWSRVHDCYEAKYTRGDKSQKVLVNRNWIRDATAAIFDINRQLHRGDQVERHQRRRRRPRPGRRQREAQRAGVVS